VGPDPETAYQVNPDTYTDPALFLVLVGISYRDKNNWKLDNSVVDLYPELFGLVGSGIIVPDSDPNPDMTFQKRNFLMYIFLQNGPIRLELRTNT
jgi:hypothetical protein